MRTNIDTKMAAIGLQCVAHKYAITPTIKNIKGIRQALLAIPLLIKRGVLTPEYLYVASFNRYTLESYSDASSAER